MSRLEELKSLLSSSDHVTAAELASRLGVSLRTLNRDLGLLRDSGMPIDADRGRGGGLRLNRRWSVGRVNLDYREAIDALLSLAVAEKLGSALLLDRARSARHKLAATFSPAHQARIRLMRRRILIGDAASPDVMATYAPGSTTRRGMVAEAFFEMKRLEITYMDGQGRRTVREVEPQFLYLSWPVWYLLSWDELRRSVRTFRLDRIVQSKMKQSGFKLRNELPFLEAIEHTGERL